MMRRMLIDAIRNDPDWNNGDYTTQPRSLRVANVFYGIATNGGTLAYQKAAPTREKADKLLDDRLAAPFTADANDFLYQWDSSRDYNPSPRLERIKAALLAINSADDERNPPETGLMERELKRVPNGRLLSDPGERGHARPRHHRAWRNSGSSSCTSCCRAPRGGRCKPGHARIQPLDDVRPRRRGGRRRARRLPGRAPVERSPYRLGQYRSFNLFVRSAIAGGATRLDLRQRVLRAMSRDRPGEREPVCRGCSASQPAHQISGRGPATAPRGGRPPADAANSAYSGSGRRCHGVSQGAARRGARDVAQATSKRAVQAKLTAAPRDRTPDHNPRICVACPASLRPVPRMMWNCRAWRC